MSPRERPDLRPRERGQAVVEYVAWTAILATLLVGLGAALVAAGVPRHVAETLRRVVGDGRGPAPTVDGASPTVRALVLAAVHGSPDGEAATVGDAERLLAGEIGPEPARAEIERLALADFVSRHGSLLDGVKEVVAYGYAERVNARFSGVGPPSTSTWHAVERRRTGEPETVHVVTAPEAARFRAALHRRGTDELRRHELTKLVAEAGLGFLGPWVQVPLFALQLTEAIRSRRALSAFPPGLRADDVVLCLPVRRVNVYSSDWRYPGGLRELDFDRWHDMTHLVTLRSGAVVQEVLSDATTCT